MIGHTKESIAIFVGLFLVAGISNVKAGDYEKTKNENKVIFLLGQDTGTLQTFKSDVLDVDPSFPKPGGTTIYTNLVIDDTNTAPLQGLFQTANYGSGRNDLQIQLSNYGGALAIGLFLVDTACNAGPNAELRNTTLRSLAGDPSVAESIRVQHQRWLDEFIDYLKATGRTIYLRIGYEFDGPWNCYTPETYVAAFRAIKRRLVEKDAHNVLTVWQSASYLLSISDPRMSETHTAANEGHLERWYPGDKYVDLLAISFFSGENYKDYIWDTTCLQLTNAVVGKTPRELQDQMLDFARVRGKKVMIAEAAPQGFDLEQGTAQCPFGYQPQTQTTVSSEEIWNIWYGDFFDYIYKNRDVIEAVSYINTEWKSQPLWTCDTNQCPSGYWGDTRIQADPYILAKFKHELTAPHFVMGAKTPEPFVAPLPSANQDRLEAEYAATPAIWDAGDSVSGTGTNLADINRSNGGTYIIFQDGGSLTFERGVKAGNNILINFASVTDGAFDVLVDGQVVQEVAFTNSNFTNMDVNIPTWVNEGAEVTLRLTRGFVVFFDYIEIQWL